MSTAATSWRNVPYDRLPVPTAVWELIAYLVVVASAALGFITGWLSIDGAVILTVALLSALVALAWIHLGQGRHPAFLFLSSLLLFQGGRLIGFCLGVEDNPMQVALMTPAPFYFSREQNAIVLLALVISAFSIYWPCRWLYRAQVPPVASSVKQYLPYLYLVFAVTLPVQLFKNFRYFEYVREQGGYTVIYMNHAAIAATVPFWVRAIPIITLPVFVAIFVFERRKVPLYISTILYFATASLILLLGSRSGPFLLVASLWWVSRVKSGRKLGVLPLVVSVLAVLTVADLIQVSRQDDPSTGNQVSLRRLVVSQGASLNVTQVAFAYRDLFASYFPSYLATELQNAFVANDVSNYQRGKALAIDVSVFLNPSNFIFGYGTAGSYLAESYVAGGMVAVIFISLLIALGLHALYRMSASIVPLFVVAMCLPDIIAMPKGELLDWFSVFLKNCLSFALLWIGWKLYSLLLSIRKSPALRSQSSASAL